MITSPFITSPFSSYFFAYPFSGCLSMHVFSLHSSHSQAIFSLFSTPIKYPNYRAQHVVPGRRQKAQCVWFSPGSQLLPLQTQLRVIPGAAKDSPTNTRIEVLSSNNYSIRVVLLNCSCYKMRIRILDILRLLQQTGLFNAKDFQID